MHQSICAVAPGDRTDAVVAVSLARDDHRILATIFDALPWKLISAPTVAQGVRQARSRGVRVVICERDPPDGNWKILFDTIQKGPRAPRFIVASRLADDRLWAEVLNVGAYDVLATPFDTSEVHRVVSYAIDSWYGQAQVLAQCG